MLWFRIIQRNFRFVICLIQLTSFIGGLLIAIVSKKECMNENCKNMALFMKSYINSEVNPCDDFYEFACGRMSSGIVSQKPLMFRSLEIQRARLVQILEEPLYDDEPRAFRMAKHFIKLCQSNGNHSLEIEQIVNMFKHLGGFPTLERDEWNEKSWSWLTTIEKIRDFGLFNEALFTLEIGFNPVNLFNSVLYTKDPTLTHSVRYMVNCKEQCVNSYIKDFVETMMQFGANEHQATADAVQVLNLEMALANNIFKNPQITEEYELVDHIRTLDNLSSSYDYIDWPKYIKIMLQIHTDLPTNSVVIVPNPSYMSSLGSVFEKTPKRLMANYLMWSVLHRLENKHHKHWNKNKCYNILESAMPVLLQSMYLNRYNNSSYEKAIEEMITEIKNELVETVINSRWMEKWTRQEASSKAKDIFFRIGYPKTFLNATFIDEYYKFLSLNMTMLSSILSLRKYYWDEYYSWSYKTFGKGSWDIISLFLKFKIYIPDACYIVVDNSITLNHGILQQPVFDKDWPKYINYGRIGSIIGHELTHSLDTVGSHYDKDGRARNWWSNSSWAIFNERAQCFINQYNKFKFYNGTGQDHLPGDLEVGENIADAAGLKLSFQVYKRYANSLFWPELSLPGLDYTPEKMFFLSFAQFYCTAKNNQSYSGAKFSVHAPFYYRVLGSLQNSRYFSRTFGCANNAKMNSRCKCELW